MRSQLRFWFHFPNLSGESSCICPYGSCGISSRSFRCSNYCSRNFRDRISGYSCESCVAALVVVDRVLGLAVEASVTGVLVAAVNRIVEFLLVIVLTVVGLIVEALVVGGLAVGVGLGVLNMYRSFRSRGFYICRLSFRNFCFRSFRDWTLNLVVGFVLGALIEGVLGVVDLAPFMTGEDARP